MNNSIYKKLIKLSLWLDNNGLKDEARFVINKVAVPLGYVETSGERKPPSPKGRGEGAKTLREMTPDLKKTMRNVVPIVNIIECPTELAITPDDPQMPKVTVSPASTSLEIDASMDISIIEDKLKNVIKLFPHQKHEQESLDYYDMKIKNLASYIKDVLNKHVTNKTITVLWGIFGEDFQGSSFTFPISTSPEWIMHDIFHNIEIFDKSEDSRHFISTLYRFVGNALNFYRSRETDEGNQIANDLVEYIESTTPGVEYDDYYATFAYLVLADPDKVKDLMPGFQSQIDYFQSAIKDSISNMVGKLIFLP